jgi:hypothetical protein
MQIEPHHAGRISVGVVNDHTTAVQEPVSCGNPIESASASFRVILAWSKLLTGTQLLQHASGIPLSPDGKMKYLQPNGEIYGQENCHPGIWRSHGQDDRIVSQVG